MSQDRPSNPPPANPSQRATSPLAATLSEGNVSRLQAMAREEVNKAIEAKAQHEAVEATMRLTEGVDVITETLLLILGKFQGVLWRTNLGMVFGGLVLLICLMVSWRTQQTSVAQQESAQRMVELTQKFERAMLQLNELQKSADSTNVKVEALNTQTDSKPSIEIVPGAKPGSAKVVIRPAKAPPPSPVALPVTSVGGATVMVSDRMEKAPPPVASVVEIPIPLAQ